VSVRSWLSSVALSFGATAGLIQTYGIPLRRNQGPESRWWESVRRAIADGLARIDEQAGPRSVVHAEYAGALECSLAETEQWLWDMGFVRNPIARLKTRDGAPEAGSWVYRSSPLSRRQLHLMLFERADGGVDVYAHDELSSVHPLYGPAHFRGEGQSVGAGVRRARRLLPLDTTDAPANPPDEPWNVAAQQEPRD
jgi:hypothetical protein